MNTQLHILQRKNTISGRLHENGHDSEQASSFSPFQADVRQQAPLYNSIHILLLRHSKYQIRYNSLHPFTFYYTECTRDNCTIRIRKSSSSCSSWIQVWMECTAVRNEEKSTPARNCIRAHQSVADQFQI